MIWNGHRVERLGNGYVRVDHLASGLVYLYRTADEIERHLRAGYGWRDAAKAAQRFLSL